MFRDRTRDPQSHGHYASGKNRKLRMFDPLLIRPFCLQVMSHDT